VTVEGVTFKNAQDVNDPSSDFWSEGKSKQEAFNGVEAIHFDTCDGVGEKGDRAKPLDCTPCRDAVVKNCTFTNVFAGVGNHHKAKVADKRSTNIKVLNCTFSNIRWYCFFAIDFNNITVSGCKISNATGIASIRNVRGATIANNTYQTVKTNAGKYQYANAKTMPSVQVAGCTSGITIQNNSITNPNRTGMRIDGGNSFTISGNTIKNAPEESIRITGASVKQCKVESNTFATAKATGLRIGEKAVVTASKNTVSGTGEHGIFCDSGSTVVLVGNKVTNTAKHGIAVRKCVKGTIKSNVVSKAKGQGITVQETPKAVVTGNKVKSTDDALYLRGKSSKAKCTCTVKKNTLNSKKAFDLNLNAFLKGKMSGNVLENYKYYKHPKTVKMKGKIDIPKLKKAKLTKKTYVYAGKPIKAAVKVTDSKGRTLKKGTDYRLAYRNNNKVGTATVVVKGLGTFKGQSLQVKYVIKAK
jgi:hypothetical protein